MVNHLLIALLITARYLSTIEYVRWFYARFDPRCEHSACNMYLVLSLSLRMHEANMFVDL